MDAIELIKSINQLFQEYFGFGLPMEILTITLLLIGAITLIVKIVKGLVYICKWIGNLNNNSWRKEKIKSILIPDYIDQLNEQKYFISTKFTTTPPNNLDDPMEVERTESAKHLIDYFLDKVLVPTNTTTRFYCILAGAGMGKTTWTVNLVTSYINRYKSKTLPYEIKLISLAHKDFAELVQQVQRKEETILILDALDENAEASKDISSFMYNLEELIQKFRFVILTSRTQFFPSEEDEPSMTSIMNLSGNKGNYVYHKMYISPFTEEDVKNYLKKKYSKRRVRKKASAIVTRCSSLATRPLLLSHLDDLLESSESYVNLSGIYTALIDAWIRREVRFFSGKEDTELYQKIYEFSLNFALELFANREQSTNMRMRKEQYLTFINNRGDTDYNFSGRSLINRDAAGTLKFSHKTFYEYFLAIAKFSNPDIELPESGYEQAWGFYKEMVEVEFTKSLSITTSIAQNGVTMSMLCYGSHHDDFNYKKLIGVYDIRRVGFHAKMLNNTSFIAWLGQSDVEYIDIFDYHNEPLKNLLTVPCLLKTTIHTYGGTYASIRHIQQKLEKLGVELQEKHTYEYVKKDVSIYMDKLSTNTLKRQALIRSYADFLGVDENAILFNIPHIYRNLFDQDIK